jgi:hypothetical protein
MPSAVRNGMPRREHATASMAVAAPISKKSQVSSRLPAGPARDLVHAAIDRPIGRELKPGEDPGLRVRADAAIIIRSIGIGAQVVGPAASIVRPNRAASIICGNQQD